MTKVLYDTQDSIYIGIKNDENQFISLIPLVHKAVIDSLILPAAEHSGLSRYYDFNEFNDDIVSISSDTAELLRGIKVNLNNGMLQVYYGDLTLLQHAKTPEEFLKYYRVIMEFVYELVKLAGGAPVSLAEVRNDLFEKNTFLTRFRMVKNLFRKISDLYPDVTLTMMREGFFSIYIPDKDILLGTFYRIGDLTELTVDAKTLHNYYITDIFYAPNLIVNLELIGTENIDKLLVFSSLEGMFMDSAGTSRMSFSDNSIKKIEELEQKKNARFIKISSHSKLMFKRKTEILYYEPDLQRFETAKEFLRLEKDAPIENTGGKEEEQYE